jgi:hypothetical protein
MTARQIAMLAGAAAAVYLLLRQVGGWDRLDTAGAKIQVGLHDDAYNLAWSVHPNSTPGVRV